MSDAPTPPPAAPGNDPFQAAKASALRAAEELRTATSAKAQEFRSAAEGRARDFANTAGHRADEFREYADQAYTDARAQYDQIRVEGEKLVREKPMHAVLTAFGVGLFVGLILRR